MAETPKDLIGKHPEEPDIFGKWLTCEDREKPNGKPHNNHRALIPKDGDTFMYPDLADIVRSYYVSDEMINVFKKKEVILSKYDFRRYVNAQKLLPTNQVMQRGNMAEILMTEYLKHSSGYDPFVFRFRYNWNNNQSMKGDDILLFDITDKRRGVIFGECKYRGQACTKVLKSITSKINSKNYFPLSISAVASVLLASGDTELKKRGEQLMDLQYAISNKEVPLIYAGFYMSSASVHNLVAKKLLLERKNRIMITLGMKNPKEFVAKIMCLVKKKLYGDDAAL